MINTENPTTLGNQTISNNQTIVFHPVENDFLIEEFLDDAEEPAGAYARGHYHPEEFLQQVQGYLSREWGPRCAEDTLQGITAAHVMHLYWRKEPIEGEDTVQLCLCDPGDPKGFPVTLVGWFGA